MPDPSSVDIGQNTYPAYLSADDADAYIAADPINAATWAALDDDGKARHIVAATRLLDSLTWAGERTESDQDLAWPRSGISDVADDEIPQVIVNAAAELSALSASGTDILNFTSTGSTEKRIKAGSVEVENFRSFDDAYPLPLPIWRLILGFIGSGSSTGAAIRAFGTDGCSITNRPYDHARPF